MACITSWYRVEILYFTLLCPVPQLEIHLVKTGRVSVQVLEIQQRDCGAGAGSRLGGSVSTRTLCETLLKRLPGVKSRL